MTRHIPPFAVKALQIVMALVLLALVWHVANGGHAIALLAGMHPAWLVAALVALTLQTGLSALRWRLTAGQLGIEIDTRSAVQEYYLAQIVLYGVSFTKAYVAYRGHEIEPASYTVLTTRVVEGEEEAGE